LTYSLSINIAQAQGDDQAQDQGVRLLDRRSPTRPHEFIAYWPLSLFFFECILAKHPAFISTLSNVSYCMVAYLVIKECSIIELVVAVSFS
jgi:hypothetical protein